MAPASLPMPRRTRNCWGYPTWRKFSTASGLVVKYATAASRGTIVTRPVAPQYATLRDRSLSLTAPSLTAGPKPDAATVLDMTFLPTSSWRLEERFLDQRRNRRRRLQLNVPLRTGNAWTNRVVLNLQLQQRRQASAFAHLAHL